jgi:hydroxyacylglutathione hydrolase
MPAGRIEVQVVPCLRDNYAFVAIDQKKRLAWLVDAPEANAILAHLDKQDLRLQGILATHHHPDHTGGIEAIREMRRSELEFVLAFGGERDRIPQATHYCDANADAFTDTGFRLGELPLEILHVPGHTRGHVAFKLGDEVFTGDCLFAAGCGRLFEGNAKQMHQSLSRLCALRSETRLWFGHEYTAANLRFARVAEPENQAIARRLENLPPRTVPTTVADERATNPFVRAETAAELGRRRAAKDDFRG